MFTDDASVDDDDWMEQALLNGIPSANRGTDRMDGNAGQGGGAESHWGGASGVSVSG